MIRKSESSDVDIILDVWLSASVQAHDFIESDFLKSQVENMRHVYLPASEVFVYELSSRVIGFYALYDHTLAAIFVAPESQRKGVGKQLLQHAKEQHNVLTLTVYRSNEASCQFHLKHGFSVQSEQVDIHTGYPELVMTIGI